MPLVMPPTVIGLFVVIVQPDSVLGEFWFTLSGSTLAFFILRLSHSLDALFVAIHGSASG